MLVLLLTDHNKLLIQWKGLCEIFDKVASVEYRIEIKGKLKTYHANILKIYIEKEPEYHFKPDQRIMAQVALAIMHPEASHNECQLIVKS